MQEPADFWAQQGLIESNNTSMLTKTADGKIQASFASPEGIQAMQMVADLIKDGAALHVSWDEGCQSFIDGNGAMLYTSVRSEERAVRCRYRKIPDLGQQPA